MGVTNKMYAAVASHLSGGTSAAVYDSPSYIAFECASMAGWDATTNTFGTPIPNGGTNSTGLGAAKATLSASTTTVAGDTCTATYTFTAATTQTVYGHTCFTASTASTSGNILSWYAYAASQPLNSGDTLAATIAHQVEIGV